MPDFFTRPLRRLGALAACLAVLMVVGVGCRSETYTRSAFPDRVSRFRSIAVLPPEVRTGTAGVVRIRPADAPLAGEERVRSDLAGLVATALRRQGFSAQESPLDAVLPGSNQPIWDLATLGTLSTAFGSIELKAVRPEAKVLATRVGVDGLVFVRVFAHDSTGGRKAWVSFGNLLSIVGAAGGHGGELQSFRAAIVEIALVDGDSGDVLWRTVHDFKDLAKAGPEEIVAELMTRYPRR